ncbi:hypothetical protein ACFQ7F_22610 [Streptomyces sp. NPDC056486]|uniref:hypothetical protein n=1 Tax=Streptomyces sp. NPDC056486 TaxID=3345835 RepID=UPI003680EC95
MAERVKERGGHWSSVLLAESFLPCAEVRERLVAATRRPAADDRAEAWPLLVRNAARSGEEAQVTSVLEEMTRLANEQDPVRAAALSALAETRPALFGADAEPFLDRIRADAVAARSAARGAPGTGGADRLAEDGTHASGLFAVAAVEALGERTDWAGPWRDLLTSLRNHGIPDVRDAALAVSTSYV